MTLKPVTVLSKTGCPVVLQGEAPQFIVSSGIKLKLKAGDVVYLSEDLTEACEIVKCHIWNEKTRVDVVVARQDILVPSETVSKLKNQRQVSECITQLKGISSADYLLEKQEESKESLASNMQYFSQAFGGPPH